MGASRTLVGTFAALAAVAGAAGWFVSAPQGLDEPALASLGPGDAGNGERLFWAGGCSSCHAGPDAQGEARLSLGGGERLETQFGTFVAPNISQHPRDGIGNWTMAEFANAMLRGISPGGEHLYPAFPYTSYARMTKTDVSDLYAFMKGLPAVEGRAPGHEVSFPFNIRRGLGLWKRLYLDPTPVVALANPDERVTRGQYLVEGPGHCGECHTPRNALGAPDRSQWLAGAPSPEGRGTIPNITSGEGGIGDWTEDDIANYLETGFTPDFDSAGGRMADVVSNMAMLPPEDRAAIAAYLKVIPAQPGGS